MWAWIAVFLAFCLFIGDAGNYFGWMVLLIASAFLFGVFSKAPGVLSFISFAWVVAYLYAFVQLNAGIWSATGINSLPDLIMGVGKLVIFGLALFASVFAFVKGAG